jgi:ABC-2 type transport system ATP-binding protein
VVVELATDDDGVSALMQQLSQSGARMRSFYEREPTLEDVFMLVTKGLVI